MAIDLPVRSALGVGAVGALAVTGLHETARRVSSEAPRMDVLGRRALSKLLWRSGHLPPKKARLQRWALLGDLVSNSLFYALIGLFPGRRPIVRGAALGALAGVGGLLLPPLLGLGREPSGATPARKAMTVAWYLLGGAAAGAAYQAISVPDEL